MGQVWSNQVPLNRKVKSDADAVCDQKGFTYCCQIHAAVAKIQIRNGRFPFTTDVFLESCYDIGLFGLKVKMIQLCKCSFLRRSR